ncbi:energy-coupling factor transport system permease protein [Arthrobacter sp. PvP102]|uniref:energy-coupling factor transporter transmembrane component T n=1 Tax=unclassified Arthrobacter TaxID=235627 RepID=UPI001AE1B657|nr:MULTISPECIES: energy-coupling factor transporter transmembrane component T [unclassified Arthrobacter]MBP1235150.1 energy-coupling factor transport system permease protein [Arthrobacter sp. PvP103]MBP1236109.1 energy-coupling factor transport system permease protein [Arthrobacter sp. PvP102]
MPNAPSALHPLTALAAAVSAAAITTAVSSWAVSLAVALGSALLAARAGVAGRMAPAAAVILAPFWLSLLIMHGLFFPEGKTVLAEWGVARVTAEGLGFALDMGMRTAAYVMVFLLFSFTVRVPDLVAVMSARRVPAQLGFVLASTLTLAPAITGRLARIRQAQESRGLVLGGGPLPRLAAARLQMVPLVLSLIQDAGERAQALDSRGFNGGRARTSYREVPDTAGQRGFRAVALLLALILVVLRISGHWPDVQAIDIGWFAVKWLAVKPFGGVPG